MSVRVATSSQAQTLTRPLAGSTGGPRQDTSDASFDGIMSNVADDHATGAQPSNATPDKDATDAKDASTTATATLDASAATPASASVFSLAVLAGNAAAWTSPSGTSTGGTKVKTNHADTAKTGPVDSGPSTPADPSATPAGLSQQLSLLALVQSAADPSSAPSEGPAGDPASSTATVPTAQGLSNSMPPLPGNQNGTSTGPLISNVTFQTYLAPASTMVAPSTPPALPQAATSDTTISLADATPQADASANAALGTLIAPLAQAALGTQAFGSLNGSISVVAGSSPTDGSSDGKAAIAQAGPDASLDQNPGGVLPLPVDLPSSGPTQADTPTPNTAPATAALPITAAPLVAGAPDPTAAAPTPAPSVSAPLWSFASMSAPVIPATPVSTRLASATSQSAVTIPLASVVTAAAAAPLGATSTDPATSNAPFSASDSTVSASAAPTPTALTPAASNPTASSQTASAPSVPTSTDTASGAPVTTPVVDAAFGTPLMAVLPAPLQPVVGAITSLAAQAVQASPDTASRPSPARTMLLQLNPGELGTVSVRLHLTGRTLDVSLTASQDQTATLLDHGRDALTRAISDQDYQVNALVIQRGDPQRSDTNSLPGSNNASSTDYSRDQAASQGGGAASGGSSRQNADGSPARQDRSDRQPQARAAPADRGSGLFL